MHFLAPTAVLRRVMSIGVVFACSGLACKGGAPAASGASGAHPDASTAGIGGPRETFTLKDSDKSVVLAVGDSFAIKLPASAGTGYEWTLTDGDQRVVAPQHPSTTDVVDPRPGGQTEQVFSFIAKSTGTFRLQIALRRPWEDSPPARTFAIDVTVR